MLTLEQATRFYERLAQLIGRREGVEIKVKVTPRPKEEGRTAIERRGNGKAHIKRV